jgi:ubiquinone/menaquinone biosynthesis C-methylase UbiE
MSEADREFASDCWGRLNDVADVGPVVTTLDTLPEGFRTARRTMIRHLGLHASSHVLEAGSGPGTALPDLTEVVGRDGRITGIDPTRALVEIARIRATDAGVTHVSYAVGDIRQIDLPDQSVDAAFCDKILTHVSPIPRAIAELTRVTRAGGRVGTVEWYAQGMIVSADGPLTGRILDGSAPLAALNPSAPLELEHLLASSGLRDIVAGSVVAESHRYLPSLKTMLVRRAEQAVELRAIGDSDAATWLRELESRDAAGRFYWAAIVRWAAGTNRQDAVSGS